MTPYLRVAGVEYPKRDELGRLPLRAFTVDIPRLQTVLRTLLKHSGPAHKASFREAWCLRFNSQHRRIRESASWAKLMASDCLGGEKKIGKLIATYSYSYYTRGWVHWFKVRRTGHKGMVQIIVPFDWNAFVESAQGEAVVGTSWVTCESCGNWCELKLVMHVDLGARQFSVLP